MTEQNEPIDREAIRRRARRMAVRMGVAKPEPKNEQTVDPAALPTQNLFALRGLLRTNRLTAPQAKAARQFLGDAEAAARQAANDPQHTDPTGDAA